MYLSKDTSKAQERFGCALSLLKYNPCSLQAKKNTMFKTTQPHITAYHADLKDYDRLALKHEGTVKIAFQHLLESVAKQQKWVLTQENTLKRGPKKNIRLKRG